RGRERRRGRRGQSNASSTPGGTGRLRGRPGPRLGGSWHPGGVSTPPTITATQARRLFMGAQGLLDDPGRKADAKALKALLTRLGFVQMDSINVVARAHDLILRSRLHDYAPEQLQRLLEKDRFAFEGWTHDASAIVVDHYPHWKPRFRSDA